MGKDFLPFLVGLAVGLGGLFAATAAESPRATVASAANGDASDTDRGTLAGVASVADGFDRNAALYQFLAKADRGRIERLLAEVVGLPATPHRDDVARVLYIRFASVDPAAAADHAVRMLANAEAVSAVFRAWAHVDLDSAVARAAELPTGPRFDAAGAILQLDLPAARLGSIAESLGARLADVEISKPAIPARGEAHRAALARLSAIDDRDSRWEETVLLASDWATADPAGALAAIIGWDGEAGVRESMLSQVMDRWSKADPRAATDWLLAHDTGELLDSVFPAFLNLARTDPDQAEALLDALPEEQARRQARIGVVTALLDRGDLDRALTAFAELDLRDQPVVMGDLGAGLVRADPERALEWLMGLDETVRRDSFDWFFMDMYRVDPSVTKRLIQGMADPEMRIDAATAVAHWEMGDPGEALAWAESLGTEEQYAPVVAYMFQEWFRRDAPRATRALMEYRSGLARDRALRTLVAVRLAAHDTVAAERFFDAIESPNERRSAAGRMLRYYTETDPIGRKAAVFRELATEAD
ncbi:MAG: hypothetical protein OXQ90_17750 [Gammaproteobacteria bacterium]|nr:hypothetical protein [Gammaproteobacteria bacterium]